MRARRAACSARASAARAAFVRQASQSRAPRRRARGRPSTRAGRGVDRARLAYARPRRGDPIRRRRRTFEVPRMRGVRPGRRALRASPALRRAPSQASPGRARRARIAASATTHLALSHGLFRTEGAAPRVAARSLARTRSPSCAIAMPRSARAGASSRRATRFNAPRGSPVASARAAAVISESIGIPPHLSLPSFDTRF